MKKNRGIPPEDKHVMYLSLFLIIVLSLFALVWDSKDKEIIAGKALDILDGDALKLAIEAKDPGLCMYIKDYDKKRYCENLNYELVGKQTSEDDRLLELVVAGRKKDCVGIQNKDKMQYCLQII